MTQFRATPLTKNNWQKLVDYFEFRGGCSGCWCMNHRLPIGLEIDGEAAKLAMKQLVESGRVFGILAYSDQDETPVGWTSLDRRKTLPGHDCIAETIDCSPSVWSIHCVTTRVDFKNQGIEKLMIAAAIKLAKDLNATIVESYPEPQSRDGRTFSTWNTFSGSQDIYVGFGFVDVTAGKRTDEYLPMQLQLKIESN